MDHTQADRPTVSATHPPYTKMKDSKTPLPVPATHSPRRRHRSRHCSRRHCALSTCCGLFLALILIVGLVTLIEFLIVRPKNGNCDLQDAQVQKFNLTHSGNNFTLDTHITFQFLFSNPNEKMGFDVKGFNVHVSYASAEIGQSADVAPFYQGKRNDTVVTSVVQSVGTALGETVGEGLQGEIESASGSVSLVVVMNVKVRNDHHMLTALHPFRKVHLTCLVNLEVPKGVEATTTTTTGKLVSKSCKLKRG